MLRNNGMEWQLNANGPSLWGFGPYFLWRFCPNPPLGKTAAKKYWPSYASGGRARHKWGPDDSFCRFPVPFARPLELRSAGDRLVLYWRHSLQETRLFDAVVGFVAIRTVRMLRHRLGQNIL